MRVIIGKTADAIAQRAAEFVAAQIRRKPNAVLGLATGSTPLGLYGKLIRMHKEGGLDFSQVTTFNLDEYVGLGPKDSQSYRYFMQENLFDHINILPDRTYVPDGRALDFETYCELYERQIADAGGIDLQVLGIGRDGHIAFNEPGSSLGSRTRLKALTTETILDNARFFGSEDRVPKLAVTMGVGTILESRRCLLLAVGESKANAVRSAIEGPVTSQITASALQLHRDAIAIVDTEAGDWLTRKEYYEDVERAQVLLESGKFKELGIGTSKQ